MKGSTKTKSTDYNLQGQNNY